MLVVQVDVVGLQAPEASFQGLADGFRAAVHLQVISQVAHAALGAEHNFVPDPLDPVSHGLLVVGGGAVRVGAGVALGRVKKGVAQVESLADFFGRFRPFQRGAESVAQAHAAQAHCRDLQVCIAQCSDLHDAFLLANGFALSIQGFAGESNSVFRPFL